MTAPNPFSIARSTWRASSVALALMLAAGPVQAADALPDPRLTPGAVVTSDPALICAPGYDRAHRVWRNKRLTMRRYGLPISEAHAFQDDDLIPVCLGGDNASPLNHWAQPIVEAHKKDAWEHLACREFCAHVGAGTAGGDQLRWLQHWFATGGWAR